jgi:hypothetical protein
MKMEFDGYKWAKKTNLEEFFNIQLTISKNDLFKEFL